MQHTEVKVKLTIKTAALKMHFGLKSFASLESKGTNEKSILKINYIKFY